MIQGNSRRMSAPKNSPTANGDVLPAEARHAAASKDSKKAVTSFIGMYLLVALIVSLSWVIGYFDLSFVYVFVCIFGLFVVWKGKIGTIIAQHLNNEEANLYRKRAFRQNETAEWFNFLLNRWWVFSSSNIEELVKKWLDERLWDIRPSFVDSLQLSSFSVGDQTPNVRNVRVFECSESTPGSLQPISWFNVHRPPAGLDKLSSYQVVVEGDLTMTSEDFKMIFRGRVGSSRVNVGFDLVVEDLNLSGTIQAILHLSMDIPFPHVSKATICFVQRPDVTFNIRMLRALSMMEIPLLKSWIHNNVMEGLTKAMVDPASIDIIVNKAGPTLMGQSSTKKEKAQGVLTIHLKGLPPKEAAAEDVRYTVLSIGDRKRQTHEIPASEEWDDVCSFFIYNLATEKIKVKSKCMRLITSTTLEQKEVNLSSFPFTVQPFAETDIENKDGSKVTLKMNYTGLPAVDLDSIEDKNKAKSADVSGVLFVCIHGATNVLAADKTGASDPYCVLFCDRRRVLTTPFVPRTRNPHWESWVEFFVADYTRSSLSFFVYDWDGTNAINDDFLGSVHMNLSETEPELVKTTLSLGYNKPNEGFTVDKQCGHITVSVVFRPVASVARSEKFRDVMKSYKAHDYLYKEDLMSPSSVIPAGMSGRRSTTAAYMDELLSDKVIVELTILQGKDMVAMDRNGYSDPFCVVSTKGKKIFTTGVKKKTLFPKWNETVTTEMSLTDDPLLTIDVFDKDIISKDFMGKLVLTVEQMKELSIKGTSDWFTLDRAKSGKLQLKCSVISKDTLKTMEQNSPGPEDVFDFPTKHGVPAIEVPLIDSSFDNSMAMSDNSFSLQPPIKADSNVRRSASDLELNAVVGESNGLPDRIPLTPTQRRTHGMKHADSSNSVNVVQRTPGDTMSLGRLRRRRYSSASNSEKLYSVSGKVLRVRGNFPVDNTGVYCKVRLEMPGNRLSLFHSTRIVGKSPVISLNDPSPMFNVNFEIDRGTGISMNATLIFDIKHSSKEHLATRSFSLRSLLADADSVCKWITVGNGIELEVELSQGPALQKTSRHRSGSLFKSLSFRKDKN